MPEPRSRMHHWLASSVWTEQSKSNLDQKEKEILQELANHHQTSLSEWNTLLDVIKYI